MFSVRVLCKQEPTSIECMFCYELFKPESVSKSKTEVAVLSKLFSTFSKYMKWESPLEYEFNFEEEQFPFCSSCSAVLVRVFKLDEEIRNVISNVVSKIVDCGKQVSNRQRTDRGTEKVQFYRRQTIFRHEPSLIPMTNDRPYKPESEIPQDVPEDEDDDEVVVLEQIFLEPSNTLNPLSNTSSFPACDSIKTTKNSVPSVPNAVTKTKGWQVQKPQHSSSAVPKNHQRVQKGGRNRVHCTECQRSFGNDQLLLRHKEAAHAAGSSKTFLCQDCNQKFTSESLLCNHICAHKMVSCPICGVKFTSHWHLTRHKFSVHVDETSKVYCCQFCSQKYASQSLLKKHMDIYHYSI